MIKTTGPSPHLGWVELGCHDGTPYPDKWRADRAKVLAKTFEDIRELCGNKPIQILSAYRTETYNKKIGGAKFSQHCQGRALDLVHSTLPLAEFLKIIKDNRDILNIHGLGIYPTFIHVDNRPENKNVTWYGGRINN